MRLIDIKEIVNYSGLGGELADCRVSKHDKPNIFVVFFPIADCRNDRDEVAQGAGMV